ncbi:MAG: hypothetical protein GY906_38655 [bacterium]|nr:hypothetical protein [bacterium]
MGFKYRVIAKTKGQLQAIANPASAQQPEALPWILFDSQTYTSAATTRLRFFNTTNVDPTLSNMETAGALPDPQWFEVHYIGMDILRTPTAGGAGVDEVGGINDIELLLKAGRGTWTLNLSNKQTGQFPITFLHGSGGATGEMAGGIALQQLVQLSNNGTFDGGFCVDGSIVYPPTVGWNFELNWAAAQTLTANVIIRMWQAGILYRRVL